MASQHYRDDRGVRYAVTRDSDPTIQRWAVTEYDPKKSGNPHDVSDTRTINSISKLSAFLADKTRE